MATTIVLVIITTYFALLGVIGSTLLAYGPKGSINIMWQTVGLPLSWPYFLKEYLKKRDLIKKIDYPKDLSDQQKITVLLWQLAKEVETAFAVENEANRHHWKLADFSKASKEAKENFWKTRATAQKMGFRVRDSWNEYLRLPAQVNLQECSLPGGNTDDF